MLKATILDEDGGRVVIMDSIAQLASEDADAHVVSASHGGVSAGEIALGVPLASVFFNDAGVGKDGAGIAALAMLEAAGVPAATVSHESARIGDSRDTWENGVISYANGQAMALGLVPGGRLEAAVSAMILRRT